MVLTKNNTVLEVDGHAELLSVLFASSPWTSISLTSKFLDWKQVSRDHM